MSRMLRVMKGRVAIGTIAGGASHEPAADSDTAVVIIGDTRT